VLAKISHLVKELDDRGIRYCHWKSNFSLARSVLGQTDVDLLVHRQAAPSFRAILTQQGFRPVIDTDGKPFPSVEHYYVFDDDSGELVHLHAYYRVITGESLSKNYRLPIEEMLLQNIREEGGVRVPTKAAELVPFTLRIMLKHTSLVELLLLSRYWTEVLGEIDWLTEGDAIEDAVELLRAWLPPLDVDLFTDSIAALQSSSVWRRIRLARRLRSQLYVYARHSTFRAWLNGVQRLAVMVVRRFGRSRKNMIPQSGGAVVAFVGSEATGKSTLLSEVSRWLGRHFDIERTHAGKPAPTVLTAIPNALVPVLRAVLPRHRSTHVEAQYAGDNLAKDPRRFPLIFGVRSVLLAHDRRSHLVRAFGQAANGTVVLCDRYPSLQSGLPDGPQLSHLLTSLDGDSVRRWLARIEARLYREIPPPDLVIQLNAPLEVTLLRNATRDKTEPEDYVRRRHAQMSNLHFGQAPIYRINTDQPVTETIRQVKEAVWEYL
jgi:thymidylate kinase